MIRSQFFAIPAAIVLGLAMAPPSAMSQQKSMRDQLVGTWNLLIADTVNQDGTRTPNFGPNPNGVVIFDGGGRYALELSRSNMPKFASNNRVQGTPDENKASVQGSLAHFGTYEVDDATKTLTLHIRSSSFPNWQGTVQKRPLTIMGPDDIKWITPVASGGGTAEVMWHRVK